jgi:hypothetical protein
MIKDYRKFIQTIFHAGWFRITRIRHGQVQKLLKFYAQKCHRCFHRRFVWYGWGYEFAYGNIDGGFLGTRYHENLFYNIIIIIFDFS